jgi:Zn-finger nucleic acid-binding protein
MPSKSQSTSTRTPRKKRAAAAPAFEKKRAQLDRKRAERRQKMLWAHYWLLCPKCGGDMFVQHTMGIAYEVCRDCHGIAIDGEELSIISTPPRRSPPSSSRRRSRIPPKSERPAP